MAPLLCHQPPVWIKYWIQNLSLIHVSGQRSNFPPSFCPCREFIRTAFYCHLHLATVNRCDKTMTFWHADFSACRYIYTSALVAVLKPTLPECGLYLQITFHHIHVVQQMCTMDPEHGFSLFFPQPLENTEIEQPELNRNSFWITAVHGLNIKNSNIKTFFGKREREKKKSYIFSIPGGSLCTKKLLEFQAAEDTRLVPFSFTSCSAWLLFPW